jgi:aryl-alcohol dehydrogenase-like predicted oxidoreductase
MQTTLLGRTGVTVSRLCFGTMSFGGDADEAESGRLYAACREAGITFFDCANVYAKGRSEEILGRLIAPERDAVVVTTKVGFGDETNAKGLSRRHIAQSVEASLKRLGTDRVDVLFVHRWDPESAMEETLRGLEDVVRAGKALYLGVSNWAAWQIAKALGTAERRGWTPFTLLQPMYNLVKRQAEVELLPLAQAEGLAVTPFSPVAGGLLSGKYRQGDATGRIRSVDMYARRYAPAWMSEVAERFAGFAEQRGINPVTLAVAWVAAHPAVTATIIGARNVEQLKASLAALDLPMTPELKREVDALSPTPPPATDRLEEQG